jgi:uncharacterized protein YceH (UPF0502 family)
LNLLNEYEVRVVATLVEKQITTPDYYPMTLNALINACNQKNNRYPVTTYDEETVTRALSSLREKKLAFVFHGSEARVAKYGHVFPKAYDMTPQEVAIMCVLMLRGPQTPGEIRSRSANLYNFESLHEVETAMEGLLSREDPRLIVRLPRSAGMKESRYAHLLSGDVESEQLEAPAPSAQMLGGAVRIDFEKISVLEETVASLRREMDQLRAELSEFRKQFE